LSALLTTVPFSVDLARSRYYKLNKFSLYFSGESREKLDPILDECVTAYLQLDENAEVDFKGKVKAYVSTYKFLASILPYNNPDWERLATFLNFLIPKLPVPKEDDMSLGILQSIDLESYRAEVKASKALHPVDKETAEVGPVPTSGGGHVPVPQMDKLSNIIREFNQLFDNIQWKDADKIHNVITEEIPAKVATDRKYQNAMNHSDMENARIELEAGTSAGDERRLFRPRRTVQAVCYNPQFKKWAERSNFRCDVQGEGRRVTLSDAHQTFFDLFSEFLRRNLWKFITLPSVTLGT
jgi:type I restriction enzyme R subunit